MRVMTRTDPAGIDAGRFAVLDSVIDVALFDTAPANVVETLFAKIKVVIFNHS